MQTGRNGSIEAASAGLWIYSTTGGSPIITREGGTIKAAPVLKLNSPATVMVSGGSFTGITAEDLGKYLGENVQM